MSSVGPILVGAVKSKNFQCIRDLGAALLGSFVSKSFKMLDVS